MTDQVLWGVILPNGTLWHSQELKERVLMGQSGCEQSGPRAYPRAKVKGEILSLCNPGVFP